MRKVPEAEIVDLQDFIHGAGFAGKMRAVEFVEDQQRAFGQTRKDRFQHIPGRLVDVHVKDRHADDRCRVIGEPLFDGDRGVALDELEFLLVRYRTEGLVNVEQFFKRSLIAGAGRVIALFAEPAVLGVDPTRSPQTCRSRR